MRIAKLKLTGAVLTASGLVALAGVGGVFALGQVPPPRESGVAPPKEAEARPFVPEPSSQPPGFVTEKDQTRTFTAFPDLKAPGLNDRNPYLTLKKSCPRLLGEDAPAALPGDDTYRRLLKARLQEGRLYLKRSHEIIALGRWQATYFSEIYLCMDDMRAAIIELWGSEPKVLVPWLEEFVVVEKMMEQLIKIRVDTGTDPPETLYAARRHRLAAEAALWRAKHAPL